MTDKTQVWVDEPFETEYVEPWGPAERHKLMRFIRRILLLVLGLLGFEAGVMVGADNYTAMSIVVPVAAGIVGHLLLIDRFIYPLMRRRLADEAEAAKPPRIALRPDDKGELDDVYVRDVPMFRMERIDNATWWLCCYLNQEGTPSKEVAFYAQAVGNTLFVECTDTPEDETYEEAKADA